MHVNFLETKLVKQVMTSGLPSKQNLVYFSVNPFSFIMCKIDCSHLCFGQALFTLMGLWGSQRDLLCFYFLWYRIHSLITRLFLSIFVFFHKVWNTMWGSMKRQKTEGTWENLAWLSCWQSQNWETSKMTDRGASYRDYMLPPSTWDQNNKNYWILSLCSDS